MKLTRDFLEKHSIKAAIFDMDGLLIDSEPLWQEAEIGIFTALGIPLTRKMATQTMGLRVDEVVDYWFARYPWEKVPENEVVSKIVEEVTQLITVKGKPMPGAIEILKYLHNIGTPIAIASSSSLKIIESVVGKLGISEYVNEIASAEFEEKGKPDPGVYLSAANKLGVEPRHCLTFEDSINGVKSAKSAGTICIAVPSNDVKNNDTFKIADLKINSLTELL